MKQVHILARLFSVLTILVIAQSSFAQESTIKVGEPVADRADSVSDGASTATTSTPKPSSAGTIQVGYTGIMFGPGFSSTLEGKQKDGSDLYISNRPIVKMTTSENTDIGIQPRIRGAFTNSGTQVSAENTFIFADIKKVIETNNSVVSTSLTITPRIMLPTQSSYRQATLQPSPELLLPFSINPKNSRLSFTITPKLADYIYSNPTAGDVTLPHLYTIVFLESAYTLTPSTQLTFGFYPEHYSTKSAALTSTSNEIDLGVNWDFMKGWSVNPFLAIEPVGMNTAMASKNMQINLVLSGMFL